MRRLLKCFWTAEQGASAVEFAMILPVFVTMTLGTIQMSIVYYQAGSVQFALEETAREVMVDPSMTFSQIAMSIEDKVKSLTAQDVSVTYSVDNSGPVAIAQVNATFSIEVVIPFVPAFTLPFDAETHIPLLS